MKQLVVLCFVLSNIYCNSFADTVTGRYTTVHEGATHAQKELLSQIVHLRFPLTVHNIGDAIQYCLQFSGYSLAMPRDQSIALQQTLTKSLPVIDRDFGPLSLREALETLAGPAFSLREDILNRTINFSLKPQFQVKKHNN